MGTASDIPDDIADRDTDGVNDRVPERISAYLDHLAVERGAARNTLSAYRRDLGRYAHFLADRGLGDLIEVTEADVVDFAGGLREGDDDYPPLAQSSLARTLIAVRGLHKFSLAEGSVAVNVAAAVKPPAPGRRLPKALGVSDVVAILEAVGGDDPRALRDRALLEVLYSTGARISEAVGLDVDDVDTVDRSVLLRGKGGKQRLVPIGRPALAALEAYLVRGRPALIARGTAAVFLNVRGGRLSRQSAWQVLRTAAERAGVTATVSPHTLRHSFATHLLDGGADVRVVQELLGHASVTTTQIYTMVTANTLREVWATSHPRAR